MKTLFLLMARYDGLPVIPIERIQQDYFQHLTVPKFLAKCSKREIKLTIVRTDPSSQKSPKGVHIEDLATYLDGVRATATKEASQLDSAVTA